MSNVAIIEPRQKSVLLDMADRYGMMPEAFEATLRATVVPKDCSQGQFAAFLLIAKEYRLNPILKEIYAFPAKGGGIQPIVGVDGWANLINSHPAFDGMDFEDHFSDSGELTSITCEMHRKDRTRAITATEYMIECKRPTEPWTKWPRRMLRHKAMIQAARYAFSFAGIVDPDEAERFAGDLAREVVSRPSLAERLSNSTPTGDGFSIDHVEAETAHSGVSMAEVTAATVERLQEFAGDIESKNQPDSNSSPLPTEADTPAAAPLPPPPTAAAGDLSNPSDGPAPADGPSGEDGTGDASPSSSLPEGWAVAYAGALRRAQKKDSLPKYAAEFWKQYGGWDAVKLTDARDTAVAIYDAFAGNFGDKAAIDDLLRELV